MLLVLNNSKEPLRNRIIVLVLLYISAGLILYDAGIKAIVGHEDNVTRMINRKTTAFREREEECLISKHVNNLM
jgi:hypothetical protein